MSYQLLLTVYDITEEDYRIKADTNLPDDATVKKVLKDALALMGNDPVKETDTSTYVAASETDGEAGIHWPDPDARPTY
jgi:hypothetical protein